MSEHESLSLKLSEDLNELCTLKSNTDNDTYTYTEANNEVINNTVTNNIDTPLTTDHANSNTTDTATSGASIDPADSLTSLCPSLPEKDELEPTILVSRLLRELQQLRTENRRLTAQFEAEKQARCQLETAKNALTAEIEELTRNLFEEANEMVAVEAQARWTLEQAQTRLEVELAKTQELLEIERDQTKLLRSILEEEKASRKSNDPVMWDVDVFGARLTDSYYDDFFPERSFDSRLKEPVSHWEALSTRTLSTPQFHQFSAFIDECFRVAVKSGTALSDEAVMSILGHPFMRNCLAVDVEPCLAFPMLEKSGKLKSLLKKLLPAMLKNTCTIEPLSATTTPSLASPESIRASPLSIRSFISIAPPLARSKTSSPISIVNRAGVSSGHNGHASPHSPHTHNIHTHNSHSHSFHTHTHNFDAPVFGSSPTSITSIESCPVSPTSTTSSSCTKSSCSLCDSAQGNTHRFRITSAPASSSTAQWAPICKRCRDRLVSVATMFTTLRHLLQGLHAHRPKLDVFFDFIQAKRYMFYTRSGVEHSFYALSDFEAFSKKICEHG